ncbi:VOC family protein [Aurantiacibacter flavus]|uniref:VOC family protein n=1 Tax=Aurantiacibacter flavus TaxID=3145232 RepID=A0ABV0D051_9SPHN
MEEEPRDFAVLGMGGLFFRARDPEALSAWYREMLGVGVGCSAEGAGPSGEWHWGTAAGPMVFAPFPHASDYFAADRAFMMNFRVRGLAALVGRLRAVGIDVIEKDDWNDPAVGRFARIHDPEGNPIELWEPA